MWSVGKCWHWMERQKVRCGRPPGHEGQHRRRARAACSYGDCTRDAHAKQLCDLHYKRMWKHGDPDTVKTPPSWVRRPNVGYGALHDRQRKDHGPASNYLCAGTGCASPANEWATIHGMQSFMPMCFKCHRAYDRVGGATLKGTDCPWAVLTEHDVREMRRRYATGDYTIAQIARDFKVARQTASNVIKFRTYKDVS